MASDAAMLNVEAEQKRQEGLRSRSVSASSGLLLNRQPASDHRQSLGPDSVTGGGHSHTGSSGAPYTPTSPANGAASAFSYLPGSSQTGTHRGSVTGGIVNIRSAEPVDPFFRQPRPRKDTLDMQSPGSHSRGSWTSGDWTKINSPEPGDSPDLMEGPVSGRGTPLPAYLGNARERAGSNAEDSPHPKPDYATREVDYYYGVRGPALSHMPTRRLKTGPADPEGPVSSATGWFKNIFGGKTKEKGKGFEVVRSSRMPPHQQAAPDGEIALEDQEPYRDDPGAEGIPKTTGRPRNLELDDEGDAVGGGTRHVPSHRPSPLPSDGEDDGNDGFVSDEEDRPRSSQVSPVPPMLPDIDTGGSIHIPSRYASQASSRPSRVNTQREKDTVPAVPRRSSKRTPSMGNGNDFNFQDNARLSVIPSSPPTTPRASLVPDWPLGPSSSKSQRLPFSGLDPNTAQNHNRTASSGSMMSSGSALTSHSNENASTAPTPQSGSRLGTLSSQFRDDRPSSMGYVQQHRASDGIHVVNPAEQIFSGSTAELVDDGSGRTLSSDAGRPST